MTMNHNLSKQEIMEEAYRRGYDFEYTYHGCTQGIFMALKDFFDLDVEEIFKAVSGLAGGIGRAHHTCGALIAGSIVLSLKCGRGMNEVDNMDKLFDSMAKVAPLVDKFEKEFGSVVCKDITTSLLGEYLDTRIPELYEKAKAMGFYKHCSNVVGTTARMVAEMMLEEGEKGG